MATSTIVLRQGETGYFTARVWGRGGQVGRLVCGRLARRAGSTIACGTSTGPSAGAGPSAGPSASTRIKTTLNTRGIHGAAKDHAAE